MATIDYYQSQWWAIERILDQGGLSAAQIAKYELQQSNLHDLAEAERKKLGYSGGVDGSQIIVLGDDPTTPQNEETIFNQVFNKANLSTEEFSERISTIEKFSVDSLLSNLGDTINNVIDTSGTSEGSSLAGLISLIGGGLLILSIVRGVFK